MKRILCLIMVAMAFSFAQDEPYIRNICDTLGAKEVTLQLQQIEEKQYAKPFEGDGRTIYKVGVNFSSETRRMTEWKIA